jgi:hypothetical protein
MLNHAFGFSRTPRQEFFAKIRPATECIALHPDATQCNPLQPFFPSASTLKNRVYHLETNDEG